MRSVSTNGGESHASIGSAGCTSSGRRRARSARRARRPSGRRRPGAAACSRSRRRCPRRGAVARPPSRPRAARRRLRSGSVLTDGIADELGELAKISALVVGEHLQHGVDVRRHHSRLTLIAYAPTASSGSVRLIASDETMNSTRPSAGLDAVCKHATFHVFDAAEVLPLLDEGADRHGRIPEAIVIAAQPEELFEERERAASGAAPGFIPRWRNTRDRDQSLKSPTSSGVQMPWPPASARIDGMPVARRGGERRAGRLAAHEIANAERLRQLERQRVDARIAGAEEDRERYQRLDQVAAVQVHVVVGLRDHVVEHPRGDLLRRRAVRVSRKHSVQVLAVERTDVDRTRGESRHVHHRHDDHAASQRRRIDRAAEIERRRDARVFSRMHAAGHDERRSVGAAVDRATSAACTAAPTANSFTPYRFSPDAASDPTCSALFGIECSFGECEPLGEHRSLG